MKYIIPGELLKIYKELQPDETLNHLKGCKYYLYQECTCGYRNMIRELERLERDIKEYKEPHDN